jgi:hypothetical protein
LPVVGADGEDKPPAGDPDGSLHGTRAIHGVHDVAIIDTLERPHVMLGQPAGPSRVHL